METHDIVDRAVGDAPMVSKAIRSRTIAIACSLGGALIGAATSTFGMTIRGPKQEIAAVNSRVDTAVKEITTVRHQSDSSIAVIRDMQTVVRDMQRDIRTTANLACISARARNSETAKAAGCENR